MLKIIFFATFLSNKEDCSIKLKTCKGHTVTQNSFKGRICKVKIVKTSALENPLLTLLCHH